MNEELSFFKKTSNYAALILFFGFLTSPLNRRNRDLKAQKKSVISLLKRLSLLITLKEERMMF